MVVQYNRTTDDSRCSPEHYEQTAIYGVYRWHESMAARRGHEDDCVVNVCVRSWVRMFGMGICRRVDRRMVQRYRSLRVSRGRRLTNICICNSGGEKKRGRTRWTRGVMSCERWGDVVCTNVWIGIMVEGRT